MTILIFILVLGILVLVHELGHFIIAKRNGVGAEEFGFGFPPRLIGTYKDKNGKRRWIFGNKEIEEQIKSKEETIYSLNLLPLGGFVKITGEDGKTKTSSGVINQQSFANKSLWIRFKILVAGVIMNLLLAFVLFTFAFWLGLPEPLNNDNQDLNVPVVITFVAPDTPAEKAGLMMGDEINQIIIKNEKINIHSISQVQNIISENKNVSIKLLVKHPGSEETTIIKIIPQEEPSNGKGVIGVGLAKTQIVSHNILESIKLSLTTIYNLGLLIIGFLIQLVRSLFTTETINGDVTGPIGIAKMTGQAAKLGIAFLMQFTAMLSVNLAIINILPFPGLDGGRILFLIIEKIKGAPVKQKLEQIINTIGFLTLLGLMALVIIKDIVRFW